MAKIAGYWLKAFAFLNMIASRRVFFQFDKGHFVKFVLGFVGISADFQIGGDLNMKPVENLGKLSELFIKISADDKSCMLGFPRFTPDYPRDPARFRPLASVAPVTLSLARLIVV